MNDSPFVASFDELFNRIADDVKHGQGSLYIASDIEDSIFSELLVQQLKREIKGQAIEFLGIRNIEIKPEFRGKNLFTEFVTRLESLNTPTLFHDVVNPKLHAFFINLGYLPLYETKYNQEVISYYRLLPD
jgi:hypothetical protein